MSRKKRKLANQVILSEIKTICVLYRDKYDGLKRLARVLENSEFSSEHFAEIVEELEYISRDVLSSRSIANSEYGPTIEHLLKVFRARLGAARRKVSE